MKIILPAGYELPENARPDEPFEAVATIRPDGDGSFTLIAIDGVELDGEAPPEEVEDPEELTGEQKFAAKVAMPWDS